ncbi:MAG: NUDIX hydrolase [Clostridia bacterium]|nr:NUDIX hydrolase [Clostridia bacterium]
MDLIEKEVRKNYIYKGKILNLRADDVMLPDGSLSTREYVEHRGGASVLAVDDEGYVYLVKQYRYAYREAILEIPAGKLEVGEEPIVTAFRELSEETGLIGEIEPFGLLYPTPGYTNEPLYVFKATKLKKDVQRLDDGEFLDVIRIPFADALQMVMDGVIRDAKTAYAILRYARLNDI